MDHIKLGNHNKYNSHDISRPIFPTIHQAHSIPDGSTSEDPLTRDPTFDSRSRRPERASPMPPATSHNTVNTPDRSQVAILLKRPLDPQAYDEVKSENESLGEPVTSDLMSRQKPTVDSPATFSAGHGSAQQPPVSANAAAPAVAYRGRGRPKGWKPAKYKSQPPDHPQLPTVPVRAVREAARKPKPHPNGFPKKRGRPPKQSSPPPQAIYQRIDVPFIEFLCEWSGCKAELHNAETLRLHLFVVHGDATHCQWGKCADAKRPFKFDNDELFEAHVEKMHLLPLVWHIGDGPNNQGVGTIGQTDDIPDYLKDKNGKQVTPSIRDQQLEDQATYYNNRRKLRDLIRRRDENLPDESEDQVANSP